MRTPGGFGIEWLEPPVDSTGVAPGKPPGSAPRVATSPGRPIPAIPPARPGRRGWERVGTGPATDRSTEGHPMQRTDTVEALDVIVIGAGQAGLAAAYHLKQRGRRFLVSTPPPRSATPGAPAGTPCGSSPRRSTTRCPAWRSRPRPAPTRRRTRRPTTSWSYARRFDLPVLLNCAVRRLTRLKGGFAVETSQGRLLARQVVVATGPWQKPVVPAVSRGLGDAGAAAQLGLSQPDRPPSGPCRRGRRGELRSPDRPRARRQPRRHARGGDRVTPAAAASPRPRPLLVADWTGRGHQDRPVTARAADAGPRGPGDRHPAA